jgi:hypothetical protein
VSVVQSIRMGRTLSVCTRRLDKFTVKFEPVVGSMWHVYNKRFDVCCVIGDEISWEKYDTREVSYLGNAVVATVLRVVCLEDNDVVVCLIDGRIMTMSADYWVYFTDATFGAQLLVEM